MIQSDGLLAVSLSVVALAEAFVQFVAVVMRARWRRHVVPIKHEII